jgi:hypothetical protein
MLLPSPRHRSRLRRHRSRGARQLPPRAVHSNISSRDANASWFSSMQPAAPYSDAGHTSSQSSQWATTATGGSSRPTRSRTASLPGPCQVRKTKGRHRSNGPRGVRLSAGLPARKGKSIRHREDRPKPLTITPEKILPPEQCGFSARHSPSMSTRAHRSLRRAPPILKIITRLLESCNLLPASCVPVCLISTSFPWTFHTP